MIALKKGVLFQSMAKKYFKIRKTEFSEGFDNPIVLKYSDSIGWWCVSKRLNVPVASIADIEQP